MRQLKFGVEIECMVRDKDAIVSALSDIGIAARTEQYNHTTRSHWKLTTDSSIRPRNHYIGCEVVSPILYEDNGLDELHKVLRTLRNLDSKVNKSCGIHVHHDVADFTYNDFKSLYMFMYNYKPLIDSIMPESRRSSMRNNYCAEIYEEEINRISRCRSINGIKQAIGTRYKTLNIEAYSKYGTIEFRQHSSSLDFRKISNWVELTFRILCYCKDNRLNQITEYSSIKNQLFTMRNELNIMGTSLSKYLGERIEHFSEPIL